MNDRWPRTIHKDLFSRVFVKNPRTHLLSTAPVLAGSYIIMNPHYNRDATVPQLHRASTQDQHGRCTKPCHTRAAMGSAYAHISFFSPAGYVHRTHRTQRSFNAPFLQCDTARPGAGPYKAAETERCRTRASPPGSPSLSESPSFFFVRVYSAKSQGCLEQTDAACPAPVRRVPRQYAASRTDKMGSPGDPRVKGPWNRTVRDDLEPRPKHIRPAPAQ